MPGPEVKDWKLYHALRRRGLSKQRAATIANGVASRRKHGRRP